MSPSCSCSSFTPPPPPSFILPTIDALAMAEMDAIAYGPSVDMKGLQCELNGVLEKRGESPSQVPPINMFPVLANVHSELISKNKQVFVPENQYYRSNQLIHSVSGRKPMTGTQDEILKVHSELKKKIEKYQAISLSFGIPQHEAYCDACRKDIIGIRYKCLQCPDFDLCEGCEGNVAHGPGHIFAKLYHPSQNLPNTSPIDEKIVELDAIIKYLQQQIADINM